MVAKLSERELVCAEVLVGKGRSLRQVARDVGVDESTLRYRLRRRRAGAVDGRTKQSEACAPFEDAINAWIEDQDWSGLGDRPESVQLLYEKLVREHGFSGSYKSVVRFVRRRAPTPAVRPARRVETRPGAQAQADWATRRVFVHELGGITALPVFLMPLSHARYGSMRFYRDATMLSWLDAHNRAFEFLGGVPLTVRPDYVARNIIGLLCPPSLCGGGVGRRVLVGRRALAWPHNLPARLGAA
jgi:transposase